MQNFTMRLSRLLCVVPGLLSLSLFDAQPWVKSAALPLSSHPAVVADSEPLVAEALLLPDSTGRTTFALVPVAIQGHRMTLIMDTGAGNAFILFSEVVADAGIHVTASKDNTQVASFPITIGPLTEPNAQAWMVDGRHMFKTPPGQAPVVGIMGADWIGTHYDLVFDGPARRVRVYQYASDTTAKVHPRGAWLPSGFTPADCAPMRQVLDTNNQMDANNNEVHVWLGVNGHPVPGAFDLGSRHVVINVPAATSADVTERSPHLRHIPDDSIDRYVSGPLHANEYEVQGVPLTLGTRRFAVPLRVQDRLSELDEMGRGAPYAIIGQDAVRDRVMLISFSTRRVCLKKPG